LRSARADNIEPFAKPPGKQRSQRTN